MKTAKKPFQWRQHLPALLFAAPGVLYLLVNCYWGFYNGILLFLRKYDVRTQRFFGFQTNFSWVPGYLKKFFQMLGRTVLTEVSAGLLCTVLALFLAAALRRILGRPLGRALHSALLLPRLLSWAMIGIVTHCLFDVYDGAVAPGLVYGPPSVGKVICLTALTKVWYGAGALSLVFLSAMLAIDQKIYDAAALDGASPWEQFRHITLPLLRPVLGTLFILAVAGMFRSDMDYRAAWPSFYVFELNLSVWALLASWAREASALYGCLRTLIALAAMLGANWLVRRRDPDSALF